MTTTKKDVAEEMPEHPEVTKDVVVRGEHDLSEHPAVLSGTLRNVGDKVISRDPSAPAFNRPVLGEQSTATRKTTTSDPAKKTVKAATKGDGAGPET